MRDMPLVLLFLVAAAVIALAAGGTASAGQPCPEPSGVVSDGAEEAWDAATCPGSCCRSCTGCRDKCHGEGACFNCGCCGSYKFPVPPQSTYFWPGFYSQQTMSGYVSPYRWVPLLPPEGAVVPFGAVHGERSAHAAQFSAAGARVPAQAEQASGRAKTAR